MNYNKFYLLISGKNPSLCYVQIENNNKSFSVRVLTAKVAKSVVNSAFSFVSRGLSNYFYK